MKKRILSILLTLCMVLCLLPTAVLAADEMHNVTVKAAAGGKVSTDGTNWSDSVVVSVANGTTLGDRVQYKPDEGYKLDGVTAATAIKKVVASAANTAAVDDEGNLYTAGDNLRGQLARTLDFYVDEDSVLTKVSTSAKTIDVALGVDHIVVLDENGEVWTAGCNQYGALGIDENAGKYWYGTQIETLRKVTVGDGSVKIRAVAAGQYHTILIDENGGVWTAGYNSDGQLGRSENVNSGTPNTVFKKAEGLDNVKIIGASGGTAHTVLLDESGNVWTAGNNLHGQLGRQTAKNMDSKFEKVADGISGVKITAIAAGSRYTVLLDESGNVWTAGSNGYGELGRETNGMSSSVFGKADLQGATAAKFIAAGGTTIVIDTDGNVRTSGINGHGQLGRDTGSESSDSKLLAVTDGIDGAEIIAAATGAGAYHSVLLDKNGVIRTCGSNQCGQLCRNIDLTKSKTFAAVTDGMTQTMTFDEMKNTLITSDRLFTVTAVAREKVQFEYDLNGGNWADGFTPKDFYYKDEGLLLPDASKLERTGYTFAGWETSEPTADTIKCSAKWIADTYTVTFDSTGGSEVTTKTIDVLYGEQLGDMPVPIRTGYFFRGWYDAPVEGKCYGNSDGKGTSWYDKTENCTLYAQWVINRYTITFDTAGGSEITPITQDYDTAITAPADPTREGYTFIGWDRDIPEIMPAENITVTAQWEINRYTITFDTAGGSEIAPITQDYGTNITAPADPTREGYTFIGWDKAIPTTMPAENITVTAQWKDSEKPTGEIKINENSWKAFLNNITFGLFFKDMQTVTINAADNSGETVTVEYLLSDKELTKAELDGMTFTVYTAPFGIDPDNEYIIYVRLTDKAGNTDYICSDGIVLDGTSPVITGIEDGKTYCEAQMVTITEKYVDTVTVNGTAVTLDENNSFTLAPADGEQKIVVTDKAGNTAEMTVTVNDGHTFGEWTSNGDGTHTRQCTADGCTEGIETGNCVDEDKNHICDICGNIISNHEDANQDHVCDLCGKVISNHEDANKDHVCDYCKKVISNHEDADKDHICDLCGKTISNHDDADNNHICDYCGKTISNHEDADKDHVCELCGKTISNHEDANKDHVCDYCGKVFSNHEDADKDHVCDYCGKVITNHIGGKETCRDKAVCEVCGKSYGKLDPKNHTDLKHFPAKAATEDADGNIEYWYCSGCNKYYSDKDGTKEIKKADTVTAKLKDDSKSPQTGDTSNLALWIALLFVSGGVLTGVTVFDKRKRHSVK